MDSIFSCIDSVNFILCWWTKILAFQFLSEQVFGDSYLELLTLAILISAFVTAYKHIECHEDGCHRLGKFPHGHLKLCKIHHPLVTGDTQKDIQNVTENLKSENSPN